MLTPESELEAMVVSQVIETKRLYVEWEKPNTLADALDVSIVKQKLGRDLEGAALTGKIIFDPTGKVKARQWFTLYHEIVHHLIKQNDKLYSILHDQYPSDEDFSRIIERLCNVGAAEFLISREAVYTAIETHGFSVSLVRELRRIDEVSATAASVQLASCAKHQCIMTVCKMVSLSGEDESMLLDEAKVEGAALQVTLAVSSSLTKYRIAHGILLPRGHLFYEAYQANDNKTIKGNAPVPLRSHKVWVVESEAIRIGRQVFGIFNLEPVPVKRSDYQLQLF